MILASKIGKHTRQGLKRKYEQMEWQNEQIRFFSNSGVFGVGFGNRDKGGVLMSKFYLQVKRQPKFRWVNDKYTRHYLNARRERDDVSFKIRRAHLKMNRFYKAVSA